MRMTKTARVNAPAAEVWQKLGPEYANAGGWASGVYVSRARPGSPTVANAPCTGRVCSTSLGDFTETIEVYDEEAMRVGYSAERAKMPSFMRRIYNEWALTAIDENTTEVKMSFTADIAPPFNVLMGWMMRLQFNKTLNESIEEFAYYAETGSRHARKVKADESQKAKAARAAA